MPYTALIPAEIFAVLLIFTRIGTVCFLMPIIGEKYISTPIRLGIALMFAILLTPMLHSQLPLEPANLADTLMLLAGEFMTGLFLGLIMRVLVSTLTTAGILISFISGFSSALMFNPLLQSQGILHSALLTLSGIMFMLILDLHHLMFWAMVDSYTLMPILPDSASMADIMSQYISNSFAMGLRLITPILMVVVLFYAILGFATRLMPQLHIFFIGLPVQISLSLIALSLVFTHIMLTFTEYFTDALSPFMI